MFKKLFGPKDPFKEAVELCTNEKDKDDLKKVDGLKRLRDFIDGDTLPPEKIEQIMKIFVDKSGGRFDDARAMAISGIGHMAKKNLIPKNQVDKVLQLMFNKAEDRYDTTRCNAIWTINNFVDNNIITPARIDDILVLMINRLNDKHDDTRSNAIWCIGKLALNGLIPHGKVEQVLVWMVTKSDDKYLLARINAVGCLSRLAGNNLIPQHKAEKVIIRMISKSNDRNEAVRSNAIWCICCLALNNLVPPSKVEQVILLMIKVSKSSMEDAKTKVVNCIFNIAQYNIIPVPVVEAVLDYMISNGSDADDVIRYNAIWCICDLAENNLITPNRVEDTLILVMNAVEDRVDSVKCNAIRCISSLTENNVVPPSKTRMVFMLMISHTNDENDDARAISIICIGNLVKNNRIPLSKLERVLMLMCNKLEDTYDDARAVAMWCIGHLAKMNRIPIGKMNDVLTSVIARTSDAHDGVRSNSLWTLAVLAEYNLIPQQWLEEVLRAVIRKIKDPDNGVQVTACFCVSFLCRRTPCDIGLVGKCVSILIHLSQNDDWKYRGIEALCSFVETNLMGLTDRVTNAILSAHKQGDAFYESIPSPVRKAEVSSRLRRAVEVINIKDTDTDQDPELSPASERKVNAPPRSFSPAPTSSPTVVSIRSISPSVLARTSSPSPAPGRRDSFASSAAGSNSTGETTSTSIVDVGGWTDKAAFERWRSVRKSFSVRLDDDGNMMKPERSPSADPISASMTIPYPKARSSTPEPQPAQPSSSLPSANHVAAINILSASSTKSSMPEKVSPLLSPSASSSFTQPIIHVQPTPEPPAVPQSTSVQQPAPQQTPVHQPAHVHQPAPIHQPTPVSKSVMTIDPEPEIEKSNVAFAPSPKNKPSAEKTTTKPTSSSSSSESKSDPPQDARKRSSSMKGSAIKELTDPETSSNSRTGRTPVVRAKSPFQRSTSSSAAPKQRSTSASKKILDDDGKRAAIEAARAKPLFEPVTPRRGLTRAPSRKVEHPPEEWDESTPAVIPKVSPRVGTLGKRVPSLNLAQDNNAKSSPPVSLSRSNSISARSNTNSTTKKSPSEQSQSKLTTQTTVKSTATKPTATKPTAAGKASPTTATPPTATAKKASSAPTSAAAALQVPRPSPAQRAAERARLEREQSSSHVGASTTPRGTKPTTPRDGKKIAISASSAASNSAQASAQVSRVTSTASISSQAAIMSESHTPYESTSTSRKSSEPIIEHHHIHTDDEPVSDAVAILSSESLKSITPQDLTSEMDDTNDEPAIIYEPVAVISSEEPSEFDVDPVSEPVEEPVIEYQHEIEYNVEETHHEVESHHEVVYEEPTTMIPIQEDITSTSHPIINTARSSNDLSGLNSPRSDDHNMSTPTLSPLTNNDLSPNSTAYFPQEEIMESVQSRVNSMPYDGAVRIVDLSNASAYMQRRVNRAQSNASMMSEDQDNKSVYSVESYSTNHDSSVYGAPHRGDDEFELSLLITPDRVVNTSLPSVKETITSFERMIMKKRYAHITNEGHGNKKWGDKKFREY